MNKKYLGAGLIAVAFLFPFVIKLNGLSTLNLAIIIFFGIIAWVGIYILLSELMPNPGGPEFNLWKTFLKGFVGLVALFSVLMIGIKTTDDYVKTQLSKYGVITKATVIDKNYTTLPAERGNTNQVYFLTVKFQDEQGIDQQLKSEVVEFQYANSTIGTQLQIKYSSKKHTIHELMFN